MKAAPRPDCAPSKGRADRRCRKPGSEIGANAATVRRREADECLYRSSVLFVRIRPIVLAPSAITRTSRTDQERKNRSQEPVLSGVKRRGIEPGEQGRTRENGGRQQRDRADETSVLCQATARKPQGNQTSRREQMQEKHEVEMITTDQFFGENSDSRSWPDSVGTAQGHLIVERTFSLSLGRDRRGSGRSPTGRRYAQPRAPRTLGDDADRRSA